MQSLRSLKISIDLIQSKFEFIVSILDLDSNNPGIAEILSTWKSPYETTARRTNLMPMDWKRYW